LPQMSRVGLALNLVHLLAAMADGARDLRFQGKYANAESIGDFPGRHLAIAATLVSDALEIDYSAAAAAKAVRKFRSRHPDYVIMNWPSQSDLEFEDESVQSLQ